MKKKAVTIAFITLFVLGILCLAVWAAFVVSYRRPYRDSVEACGVEPALVYAVMRAESGYREGAESSAGAVGLMQVKPSTAEFICRREKIEFDPSRLKEGEYNILLGTRYLLYLMARFGDEATVLAAYNAGEGTVSVWLKDKSYSPDGVILRKIPYPETAAYIKKVIKFKKIYEILYS